MTYRDRDDELRKLRYRAHAVGLSVVLLGCAMFYFGLHRPLQVEQTRIEVRQTKQRPLLNRADSIHRQHTALSATLRGLQTRAESVRQRIPNEPQEAEFLKQLTEIANEYQITVHDFRRGNTQQHEQYSQFTMHLKMEGSYAGICGLLDRMSRLPRIATIERMEIRQASSAGNHPLDLTLVLYYGMTSDSTDTTDEEAQA